MRKTYKDISKYFPLLIIGLIFAALTGFFFNYYEIKKEAVRQTPSDTALSNLYLAFDKWLLSEGCNVEIVRMADISTIKENSAKTILIWASSFDTNSWAALAELLNVEPFNVSVFIDTESDAINKFLEEFQIDINELSDDSELFIKKVLHSGCVLIVSGAVYFMQNNYISAKKNAEAAWHCAGDGAKNILVVRSIEAEEGRINSESVISFWQLFFNSPYSKFVGLSFLFVIICGLLLNAPVFGKTKPLRKAPGQSLQKRFLNEALFLKHWGYN